MPFANVGTAGSVILFVCSGVGLVIVGSYFLVFAARTYMVVVQGTAMGVDRIEWPDEAPIDWISQSVMVIVQLLIWIMPAGFLARALARSLLPDDPPLRYFILMGLAVWLLFPIGFLLSLASYQAGSAFLKLLSSLPSLLLFYLLSGLMIVAALALTYFGVFTPAFYALPVAAVLGTATMLIHARLVGRLGWLIGHREVTLGKPKKPRKKRKRVPTVVNDPWAVPEEEGVIEAEIDTEGEADSEGKPRPLSEEPVPDPYTVAPETTPELAAPTKLDLESHQVEQEKRLRQRQAPPAPRNLFFGGVWEFPLYPTTLKAWIMMVVLALATGAIARFMISVSPFAGGS